MSDRVKIASLASALVDGQFNSEFANWSAPAVSSPRNGDYICRNWFTTALKGGRNVDYSFEPLNKVQGSGLKLLVKKPPEMVRIWHRLPQGVLKAGRALLKLGLRGEAGGEAPPEVTIALFRGGEDDRKFIRRLYGPLVLDRARREVGAEVVWEAGDIHEDSLLSLKFAGTGTFEIDFFRLETAGAKPAGVTVSTWAATRSWANRVFSLGRGQNEPARMPQANIAGQLVGLNRDVGSEGGQLRRDDLEELRFAIQTMTKSLDLSARHVDRLATAVEAALKRLDSAIPAPAIATPATSLAQQASALKSQKEASTKAKTINWVIGPPENIGWAYGNNAERLAKKLGAYKHAVSDNKPADIAVYFDALVADRYPVEARKSVLRIGGPRPLDRLYGDDEEAMRKAFSKFDAIIALNAALYLRALRVHDNVHLIPNAIDLSQWHPSKRKRKDHAAFTVGFAASVKSSKEAEVKGYSIATGAAERVGANILFTTKGGAQIPHDRMIKDFYSNIDLLIHPVGPGREGTSNVIMEALALGVPVLTTEHSGLHGELLVDGRSALIRERTDSAFAEAIVLLQRDERLRRRLVEDGRAFAERHHNLTTAARAYENVFKQLFAPAAPKKKATKRICFAPFWEPAEKFGSSRLRAKYPSEFLTRSGRFSVSLGYDPAADVAVIVQMCSHEVMAQLQGNADQFLIYDVCDRYYENPRLFKHVDPPIDSLARFGELTERADLVIVPSRELKAQIASRLPEKPVKYVPEPVDYAATGRSAKVVEKKVVLWFGNPDRGNFDSAKPLIERLRDEYGYEPLIVSRPSYFKRYPEFLPFCRQWSMEAMDEAFAAASICIVAYDAEELTKSPNRFIAATMQGIPTLVSGSPACNEILQATGNTFAITDSLERLDEAMALLASDSFRSDYLQSTQAHINQQVGEKVIADHYAALFAEHTFNRRRFAEGPRRVAFVTHNLAIGEGAPWSLFELVNGLQSHGVEPHVFAPAHGPLGDQYVQAGVPIEVFEPTARHAVKVLNSRYDVIAKRFALFLKTANIEAVVCNTVKAAPFAEMARQAGIPSAVIVRESYTPPERFSHFRGEARLAAVTGLTNTDQVVFVANSSRQIWADQPFKGMVRIIPNGISRERFAQELATPSAEARNRLDLPEDAIIALCVGTINERKGQRELVQWYATLPPEVRDKTHLVFLGAVQNVGYRDFLRASAELPEEIQSRITVVEATDDVALYYRAADMLLLNSKSEAYPRCIVEGLCFGLPVISTRVFGVNEQITHADAGFLYDFGDGESWQKYFSLLVERPSLRLEMARAAAHSFWKLTGYSEMLHAYKAVISDMLDTPKVGRS